MWKSSLMETTRPRQRKTLWQMFISVLRTLFESLTVGNHGGKWTWNLYLDYYDDKGNKYQEVKEDDQVQFWYFEGDAGAHVEEVRAYKIPLNPFIPMIWRFYHWLIVFKTAEWWWSIEKNTEGLTLQRGKTLEDVKDLYRFEKRISGSKLMKQERGTKTLAEMFVWIRKRTEMKKEYSVVLSNFGDALFEYLTTTDSSDNKINEHVKRGVRLLPGSVPLPGLSDAALQRTKLRPSPIFMKKT